MTPPIRKLAAIVFTDIVGFTKLSAVNEPAALSLLEKQRELLKPIVEKNGGSWLKEIGDGLLLSFETTKDAVDCAIEIQQVVKEVENLNLRIGIHQGEVVFQGSDVIGDDVNIAARIEPFAAPGGVAISGRVNASLERDPDFQTHYLGQPQLKGVSQTVKAYCITSHGLPKTDMSKVSAKLEPDGFQWDVKNTIGIAASMIGLFMLINFMFLRIGYADKDETPSIAILPFENKGAEADEFYAYGISSDLIADVTSVGLIRVAGLKDIEKLDYSNMSYDDLSKKLFVRYVAQGTLWKMDSIFQLSMEIFDTKLSKVVYTKRWQTNWTDLPSIKDDLSDNILETLEIKILQDPEKQIVDSNPKAYAYYLEAKHRYEKRENKDDIEIARGLLNKAIELDDNLIKAKILLGATYVVVGNYDMAMDIYTPALKQAELNGDKRGIGSSLNKIGQIYVDKGKYDQALNYFSRALNISEELGNKSRIRHSLGNIGAVHWAKGDYDQALNYFSRTLKINEELGNKIGIGQILINIGITYVNKGEYNQALDCFNRALKICEELGNKSSIGSSLHNIGVYYYHESDYVKAVEYLERSLHIQQEIGDKHFELFTTTLLYLTYKKLGKDYDEQEIHRLIKEEENILFETNFRLYELLEDKSFLETAYNQIQQKADDMEDELKEEFLNYPTPRQIVEEWEGVS